MQTYNLCLLGFGNVGRAFAELLQRKTPELRDKYGIAWRIAGVSTRRLGWLAQPDGFNVSALLSGQTLNSISPAQAGIRDWLAAAHADVLFENTPLNAEQGQPAIDHLRVALESRIHAITANKGPIVHAYHELRELAAACGKHFLFESTVMDGA